jgi:CRP/FNR family transcriptional regulator
MDGRLGEVRSTAAAHLARTGALQGVEVSTLQLLARHARLVHAGSASGRHAPPRVEAALLVLLSGHAAVATPDKVMELPGRGAVIGEESLFGAHSRAAPRLIGHASALWIPGEAVRYALDQSPRLVRALLANLALRQLRIELRIECRLTRRAAGRLAGFILRQLPAARGAPQSFQLPAPKVDIASLLSMTKESLSRNLARLSASGLVGVRHRRVLVPDAARLAAACDCPQSCTACDGIACA